MRPPKPHSIEKGFTLIELLIVVAIIAILAAIAVPNFLEAQTRSKVSRVRADMRSQALTLEAYFVDNNKYPPDFSDTLAPGRNNARINPFAGRLSYLTTPIAYQSSLFRDIFADTVADGGAKNYSGAALSPAPYFAGGVLCEPITFDYAKFDRSGLPIPNDTVTVWARITAQPESVSWALNSPGPDTTIHAYLGSPGIVLYDPSNGTISKGQVTRTNISANDSPTP